MSQNKPRLTLIKSGCQFIGGPVVDKDRWHDPMVKDFWIRLMGLINEQFDGLPDSFQEAVPEMAQEIFKEKV